MHVIAVDDEPLALSSLARTLREAVPSCTLDEFSLPEEAVEHACAHEVDVALLDIEMPGMTGIECARRLKSVRPDVKIVFVTSYDHYALEAFSVHATGYLLKPVACGDLLRELTFAYGCGIERPEALLRVQTFGGFEAWAHGRRLVFKRAKSKELLALLVDKHGAGVSAREASAVLWEDEPYTQTRRSYYQTVVAGLRKTLQAAGASDVLVKSWNSLAVDVDRIDCDSYRFAQGDPIAVNGYRGDYLPAYSWAEFSVGLLEQRALGSMPQGGADR